MEHPLGTHQVSLRAFDVYGEMNTDSAVITLAEPDAPGVSEGGLSTMVLGALGMVVFLGALVVLALMLRRGGGGEVATASACNDMARSWGSSANRSADNRLNSFKVGRPPASVV